MSSDSKQDTATEASVDDNAAVEEQVAEAVVSTQPADSPASDESVVDDITAETDTEVAEPENADADGLVSEEPALVMPPLNEQKIQNIIEAALMAAGQPLSIDRMLTLFLDGNQPSREEIRLALETLSEACEARGIELIEVGSGFRYQAKQENAEWVARLWEEKPARYSRALLETLALIAYRQPITRGEIEDIRGVSVSTNIMKTLMERDWVKVVGHRDVPGKPAMYASTKQFLDYFSLKGLGDLPSLAEIRDIDSINAELDLAEPDSNAASKQDEGANAQLDLAANDASEKNEDDETSENTTAAESTTEMTADVMAETDKNSDEENGEETDPPVTGDVSTEGSIEVSEIAGDGEVQDDVNETLLTEESEPVEEGAALKDTVELESIDLDTSEPNTMPNVTNTEAPDLDGAASSDALPVDADADIENENTKETAVDPA